MRRVAAARRATRRTAVRFVELVIVFVRSFVSVVVVAISDLA